MRTRKNSVSRIVRGRFTSVDEKGRTRAHPFGVRVTENRITLTCIGYVRDRDAPAQEQDSFHATRTALIGELKLAASHLKRARGLAVTLALNDDVDDLIISLEALRLRAVSDDAEAVASYPD